MIAACPHLTQMHMFGVGYACAQCREPVPFEFELKQPSQETLDALKAIDENILEAAKRMRDIMMD